MGKILINQSSDTSKELRLQLHDAELEITAAAVVARKIKGSGEGSKYGIDGYLQLKTVVLGNIRTATIYVKHRAFW